MSAYTHRVPIRDWLLTVALSLLGLGLILLGGCGYRPLSLDWSSAPADPPPPPGAVAATAVPRTAAPADQDELTRRVTDYAKGIEKQMDHQNARPPSAPPRFTGPQAPNRFAGGVSARPPATENPSAIELIPAPQATSTASAGPDTPDATGPAPAAAPVQANSAAPSAAPPVSAGGGRMTPAVPSDQAAIHTAALDGGPSPGELTPTRPHAPLPMVTSAGPRVESAAASMDDAITVAQADAEQRPTDLGSQLKLRLLYVASGRTADARAAWSGGTADQQKLLRDWVEASIVLAHSDPSDADGQGEKALAAIERLREQLADQAPLKVTAVRLVSRVDGFGVVTPFADDVFRPGQWVIVYSELENFSSQVTKDGQFETHLSLRVEVLAADGRSFLAQTDDDVVDRSLNRRRDFFIARRVRLPANLAAGQYVVRVSVTDKPANKVGESIARFQVK
ncbi:MAG: hypothetical protein BIFFINMI_02276 [Phycisphaerae bacterium]|nr:hypothetical protein [Phycisphaerae bacterium]